MSTNQITTLGVLLATASALHYIERLWLGGAVYPGIKLGLANSITMVVLLFFGLSRACIFSIGRVLLVGLLMGSLGTVSFVLSLSGAIISTFAMAVTLTLGKGRLTLAGVGAVGGVSHNLGQLAAYAAMTGQTLILGYGPKLVIFGTASGFILGMLVQLLINRLYRATPTIISNLIEAPREEESPES